MNRYIPSALKLSIVALLLALPHAAHAARSYDNCTGFITSLPAVITTQGTWCLKNDLSTAMNGGNAIEIQTNNVTIDCNDFKLGGLAAGLGTAANGIYSDHRLNATIRHCNIRGFLRGISLQINGAPVTTQGSHLIEDNRLDGNTFVAIDVNGEGSVIRRNRIFDTGGSTLASSVMGISATNDVDVMDNTVTNVFARSGSNGAASGIEVINGSGSVNGNRVRGVVKDGTGLEKAINFESSGNVSLRDNELTGNGSTGSIGMSCQGSHDRAKDNVISAFATALSGCSDDGGNVVVP